MTISVSKEPTQYYPAYNDSYIIFSSDLADNNRAEIQVLPTSVFPNKFVIYPDSDGNYVFNLKEAAIVTFGNNRFRSSSSFEDVGYTTASYFQNKYNAYIDLGVTIEVFSDEDSETSVNSYRFARGIKQVGESIFDNQYQLLSYSSDGVNYYMTYFEGFPFNFDMLKVDDEDEIVIKNLNTGNESDIITVSKTTEYDLESFRIFIEKGS